MNGSKVCDVSEADQATVDQAVKGARAAMAGQWGHEHRRSLRAAGRFNSALVLVTGRRWLTTLPPHAI